jgi:hypothetical protein
MREKGAMLTLRFSLPSYAASSSFELVSPSHALSSSLDPSLYPNRLSSRPPNPSYTVVIACASLRPSPSTFALLPLPVLLPLPDLPLSYSTLAPPRFYFSTLLDPRQGGYPP